jgi:hypothetical protein
MTTFEEQISDPVETAISRFMVGRHPCKFEALKGIPIYRRRLPFVMKRGSSVEYQK